jgi:hypothetical protein
MTLAARPPFVMIPATLLGMGAVAGRALKCQRMRSRGHQEHFSRAKGQAQHVKQALQSRLLSSAEARLLIKARALRFLSEANGRG